MNRQEYLASKNTNAHREYYAQFVDGYVRVFVEQVIGRDAIMQSKDPYLNDIPLRRWDRMEPYIRRFCLNKMANINGRQVDGKVSWSLGDAVCIAKEAAKQIKDQQHA